MVSAITLLLFFLSAAGLVTLILCIVNLVAPFTGWKCMYQAAVPQITIEIPKAGSYSICVTRNRFWLLNGSGPLANAYPQVDFFVTGLHTGEQVPCYREFGVRSTGVSKTSRPLGYFDLRVPGVYVVAHQGANQFMQDDEILIRKRLPVGKFVLLVLGIILGSSMFITGAVVASLMLFHVI